MDVAALPSRGTSLQTAAEPGAATPRHSRAPAARADSQGLPCLGEREFRNMHVGNIYSNKSISPKIFSSCISGGRSSEAVSLQELQRLSCNSTTISSINTVPLLSQISFSRTWCPKQELKSRRMSSTIWWHRARARSEGSVPGRKVYVQIHFTALGMMPSITQSAAIASHNSGSHLYSVPLFWEF